MRYCSINYQQVDSISVQDRGLAYGDGLFTTAKIVNGQIEMFTAHLQRLKSGCDALELFAPDFEQLTQQVGELAKSYPLAVLKIIVTAGVGGRGYSRQGASTTNVIIMVFDFPQHYFTWQKKGICLGIAEQKLGLSSMLAGIKHLNRLEQVMIKKELDQRDEDDLLVLDINNNIIETSCANIFWCKNNNWYTPKITRAGIDGLMKAKIIAGLANVVTLTATLTELENIEAMFMCNSVMGVVPIKIYNGQKLPNVIDSAIVSVANTINL